MVKNPNIDNIIFDLGGVLYRINYWETFIKLGELLDIKMVASDRIPDEVNDIVKSYNSGLIKTETFIWKLQKLASAKIPLPNKIISAWNAMLIGWEVGIFEFLGQLKSEYNLYLYSNINDLHFQALMDELAKTDRGIRLDDYFQGMAFSHLIKRVKPDPQSFKYVLNLYDLDPARTFFVDDFPENIQGAQEAGMKASCHKNVKSITDCFFSYMELVC